MRWAFESHEYKTNQLAIEAQEKVAQHRNDNFQNAMEKYKIDMQSGKQISQIALRSSAFLY